MSSEILRAGFALLILSAASGSEAAVRDWPGAAPCNGSLQACIDASASGDRINVLSSGSVGSSLNLGDKSLRLIAPPGAHPEVGSGGILGSSFGAAAFSVQVEGFTVLGGSIDLAYYGSGTSEFKVIRNRIHADTPSQTARILLRNGGSGALDVLVDNNRIRAANTFFNNSLIAIESSGGTLDGKVTSNQIDGLMFGDGGWGIGLLASQGTTMNVAVGYNTVRGRFSRAAIGNSEGLFSSTPSSLTSQIFSNVVVCGGRSGTGIGSIPNEGDIDTDIVNNTIVTCDSAASYSRWSGSSGAGGISGILNSNLIAFNRRGYSLNPEFFGTITRADNLIHGNGTNQPGAVASDTTADPLLYSIQYPYLQAGSPAINSGNPVTPILQAIAGLDNLDADGLRRLKGSQVDIGAYEYGDVSRVQTANSGNTSGTVLSLASLPFGTNASARPFATPRYVSGTPAYTHPPGVYFSSVSGSWAVFSEDGANIPLGTQFNLLAPEPNNGVFVHESSAANISGPATSIDHSALNDHPDAFVHVTQDWLGVGSGGAGIYNPHPVGVSYFAFGGPGGWLIWNIDLPATDMPEQARFHVYTQDKSSSAFVVTATGQTRSGQTLWIDHPLLNGTPCAMVQATRLFDGVATPQHFDVLYSVALQRWTVRLQNVPNMPLGQQYSVLINPRQIQECAGPLFADGFE